MSRPWTQPGNIDAEILGGGRYLNRDGVYYFFDGGLWAESASGTQWLCGDDGGNLNLSGGWLYYTVGAEVRRLSAAGLRHHCEAAIDRLRQHLGEPVHERQFCAMFLLLRCTRIRGFVQFLVDLLPIEHHRDTVANFPVLLSHYGVICLRHTITTQSIHKYCAKNTVVMNMSNSVNLC